VGQKAWTEEKNEDDTGTNPYAFGYREQAKNLVVRKRTAVKEVGEHIFNSTCRPTVTMDDKIAINSLN